MVQNMRIGLDFDNTIACYDRTLTAIAKTEGLLPDSFSGVKPMVRAELLRQRPDGFLWERLQGLAYGSRIEQAQLFPGFKAFLERCRAAPNTEVFIVSHKTELAHHDPRRTNLHQAARGWLETQGLVGGSQTPLKDDHLFFEVTREMKVRRIGALACEVFVDDLSEVLEHPAMPASCRCILFSGPPQGGHEQYQTWRDIGDALFIR